MKIDFYEKNLERVQDWIKNADDKVSIFIAFQGVVATFGTPFLFKAVSPELPVGIVFCVASLSFLGASFIKSVLAIKPNIKVGKHSKSFTYFGDIASQSLDQYKKRLGGVSDKDYEEELIDQTHISSKIAHSKHLFFQDAIIYFSLSMVLALVTAATFFYGK